MESGEPTRATETASDEHAAVLEHCSGMIDSRRREHSYTREDVALGIKDLEAGPHTARILAAGDEHAAVQQERRGVPKARLCHLAHDRPRVRRRIVDLPRPAYCTVHGSSTGDQDAPVLQRDGYMAV